MTLERFTDRSRKVMQLAQQECLRFNHEYVGTEHILLGLIKEGSGVAANVLKNMDLSLAKVRMEVEKCVQEGDTHTAGAGKLPLTPRAKKVLDYAVEQARLLNHNYVGTEHLLLGLLKEQEGIAVQVLTNLGLTLDDVREEILNLLGQTVPAPSPSIPVPDKMDDLLFISQLQATLAQRGEKPARTILLEVRKALQDYLKEEGL